MSTGTAVRVAAWCICTRIPASQTLHSCPLSTRGGVIDRSACGMTELDSDAILDAPARRLLNQCRQACSNAASASGLHG